MSKVAHYLQEHLSGEVITNTDARKYFATDGSVFEVEPAIIVYPRNENDVRKATRFTWQLAERGRRVPITARGAGTDQSGAAIGEGIILVFPAHMNRILEFDAKTGAVTVEPGLNYGKMQQALFTHGKFLPPFPASIEYSTVGGAVGNNAGGDKSVKYGSTRKYVKSLRFVLANGEVIETRRLSKRELSRKMGLATFEGEIYRSIDKLIEENHDLVNSLPIAVTKNSAGYDLASVKGKGGSFDLTPLLVGSQGTLGVVTEIVFGSEPYIPTSTLIVAGLQDVDQLQSLVEQLNKLPYSPSAVEVVDQNLLNFVNSQNPNQLKDVVKKPIPKFIVLIEFDNASQRHQKKMRNKVEKILSKLGVDFQIEVDEDQKEELWKIRHSAGAITGFNQGKAKAVPIIEDGIVPLERFGEYLHNVYSIFKKFGVDIAVWGHAGDANLHMQPFLDLSQVGDRQKVFKIIDEYYSMVINLGGSTTGQHGDGRLRGPYLPKLYGQESYELFKKVKNIFDPYNTMNPGVKLDVTLEDAKRLLRYEYSLGHLYDHMPRM